MTQRDIVMDVTEAIESGDTKALAELLHEDFTTEEFFPESMGKAQFLVYIQALKRAFPDMSLNMRIIEVGDCKIRGLFSWCGTHTGVLDLPFERIPKMPATGVSVALPREPIDFIFSGERIVKTRFETASDGDFRGILRQLGAELEGNELGG